MAQEDISGRLDRSHRAVCKAAFLIVMQIVQRRFRRADTDRAGQYLEDALRELGPMISKGDGEG